VTTAPSPSYAQLSDRIERGHRRSLLRTIVLSIAVLAVAAGLLFVTLQALERANRQLDGANQQIASADRELQAVTRKIATTSAGVAVVQAGLATVQISLQAATQRAAALQAQVATQQTQLAEKQAQLAAAQTALADALDLGKQVYTLNWGELKLMYVENGPAVEVLEAVQQMKDQLRWGLANTREGGYTSPGFARLVLQQLRRLPPDGELSALPRDDGLPQPGDVVLYDSGYALFYFRDHERREFVIGMTPFGVASLNYDFGVKRTGVLRSGFPQP
jgi:hypothetical protein